MAGAGYDIGFSGSDAKSQASQAITPTYFNFQSKVGIGDITTPLKAGADATSTTKSPGTTNLKDEETDFGLNQPSGSNSSNAMILGIAAVAALLLISRK